MGLMNFLMSMEDKKTQRAMQERELKFKETYEAPYMEAMTKYQGALADETADMSLRDKKRRLVAAQGMLTRQQAKELKQQYNVYSEGLASSDPAERSAARNAILRIDASKALAGQLDTMNTQLGISKVMIDILGELRMQDAQKRNLLESNLNLLLGSPDTGKGIYGTKTFEDMVARSFGEAVGAPVEAKPGGEQGGGIWPFNKPLTGTHRPRKGTEQASQNPELEGMLNQLNSIDLASIEMGK